MSPKPTTAEALAAVGVARERREAAQPRTRLFRGTIDGRDVLVTIHDPEGYGEIAFRVDGRWSAPAELHEEA